MKMLTTIWAEEFTDYGSGRKPSEGVYSTSKNLFSLTNSNLVTENLKKAEDVWYLCQFNLGRSLSLGLVTE